MAAAVHHNLLPKSNQSTTSVLQPRAAAAAATAAAVDPSLHERQRANCNSITIPTTLSNLFHLPFAVKRDHHHSTDYASPSPAFDRRTPAWSPREDISSLRHQLHGSADWAPLLDPLHPWLRREIVKYGELAAATYDAFDFNPFSEYCGSCLYGCHHLFSKLGLSRHGYDVTKYLYAMSHVELPRWLERPLRADAWSHDSNWMGYVAVSRDDETRRIGCRNIVVAWRGTVVPSEWFEDIQGRLDPLTGDAMVEHGFLSIYSSKSSSSRYNKSSASEQVMKEIKRLVHHYREKGEQVSLTMTGHSLGGALALLSAYEAATVLPDLPVSVITFGAPRVGNEAFGELVKVQGIKVLRMVVKQDVVPRMPGILFNEGLQKRLESVTGGLNWVYAHAGVELGLDVRSSPYLKRGGLDLAGFHSLETYLHLVDGHVATGKGFRKDAKRDVALVNKACGLLRDDLRVPACWNQSANKGLVRNAYGRWVLPKRDPEDIPSPLGGGSRQPVPATIPCSVSVSGAAADMASNNDIALIL